MIAKETYRVIKSIIGPWARAHGFKVAKASYLTYQGPVGDKYCTIRFRCHHHGWDKYKGSSFAVWVLLAQTPDIELFMTGSLASYLTLPELEYIRARQNRILSAIPQPPPEHVNEIIAAFKKTFKEPQSYIELYLKDWQLVTLPYCARDEIWFRYFSEEDVRSWAILMHNYIEVLYQRFQKAEV